MPEDLPKEYKLGFASFLGCRIDLSLRPFIPRPETEQMAKEAIQDIRKERGAERFLCLDLFAGSGCIGIALLKHLKNVRVDFGEKNPLFLRQIKINLVKNKIPQERYGLIKTDVFSGVSFSYDCIIANPPYVAENRRGEVQPSVLNFEPREALFAGPDGLDIVKVFLAQAKNYLKPRGRIFMEFDPSQKKEIENILKLQGYPLWKFFLDRNHLWRWVRIIA